MSQDELNAGFLRQRRFLIAVSLALAAIGQLGLTFEDVNILGNTAKIGQPENVTLIGYSVLVWAFIRYMQWFEDCGASAEIKKGYFDRWQSLLMKWAIKNPPTPTKEQDDQVRREADSLYRLKPKPYSLEVRSEPGSVAKGKWLSAKLRYQVFGLMEQMQIKRDVGGSQYETTIPKSVVLMASIRTLVGVTIFKRYFTEYFMPIVFALSAVFINLIDIVNSVKSTFGWG